MDTRNLQVGDLWTTEITKGIDACGAFLLFMSGNSMSSDNVRREVQLAFEKKKRILLLRLNNAPIPEEFQFLIAGIQWTEYSSPDWESRLLVALGSESATKAAPLIGCAEMSDRQIQNTEISRLATDKLNTNPEKDSITLTKDVRQKYYLKFTAKYKCISDFESKINQGTSNLNILFKAMGECGDLEELSRELESDLISFSKIADYSPSDLKRIVELANSITNEARSATDIIASGGNATSQLGQIKQNLSILRKIIDQLICWLRHAEH